VFLDEIKWTNGVIFFCNAKTLVSNNANSVIARRSSADQKWKEIEQIRAKQFGTRAYRTQLIIIMNDVSQYLGDHCKYSLAAWIGNRIVVVAISSRVKTKRFLHKSATSHVVVVGVALRQPVDVVDSLKARRINYVFFHRIVFDFSRIFNPINNICVNIHFDRRTR